jgi:hypothetical protein
MKVLRALTVILLVSTAALAGEIPNMTPQSEPPKTSSSLSQPDAEDPASDLLIEAIIEVGLSLSGQF